MEGHENSVSVSTKFVRRAGMWCKTTRRFVQGKQEFKQEWYDREPLPGSPELPKDRATI